jgi:hypothetical protein
MLLQPLLIDEFSNSINSFSNDSLITHTTRIVSINNNFFHVYHELSKLPSRHSNSIVVTNHDNQTLFQLSNISFFSQAQPPFEIQLYNFLPPQFSHLTLSQLLQLFLGNLFQSSHWIHAIYSLQPLCHNSSTDTLNENTPPLHVTNPNPLPPHDEPPLLHLIDEYLF